MVEVKTLLLDLQELLGSLDVRERLVPIIARRRGWIVERRVTLLAVAALPRIGTWCVPTRRCSSRSSFAAWAGPPSRRIVASSSGSRPGEPPGRRGWRAGSGCGRVPRRA